MNARKSFAGLAMTVGACVIVCLTGCSPSAPMPGAAPSPAPSTSNAASSTSASAPSPSLDARPAGDRCRLGDLSAERGDGAYVAGTNQLRVIWTNRSERMCTMDGFGGVDLLDPQGRRVSAARSEEAPAPVRLAPGGSAHSTISYPAAGGTGVFSPSAILATPPNETRSARLAWGTGGVPTFEAGSEVIISPVRPDVS